MKLNKTRLIKNRDRSAKNFMIKVISMYFVFTIYIFRQNENTYAFSILRDDKNDIPESAMLHDNTESESENSQLSSTGRDFEMVDAGDVDTS